mmetsp:Transcript_41813/g.118571  ORF Transcript_41813/g.118571 Transcript_41813/m.118571 type:complete len:231 (+) Transcript_41813:787-1479(+)
MSGSRIDQPPAQRRIPDSAADWRVMLPSVLEAQVAGREIRVDRHLEAIIVLDSPHRVAVLEHLEGLAVAEVNVVADHLELRQHTRPGHIRPSADKSVEISNSESHRQLAVATQPRQIKDLAHLLPAALLDDAHGHQQVRQIHLLVIHCQQLHRRLSVGRPSQPRLCPERVGEPLPQLKRSEEVREPPCRGPQPHDVCDAEEVEGAPADKDVCKGMLLLRVLHHAPEAMNQ